jgi:hypothetical protein
MDIQLEKINLIKMIQDTDDIKILRAIRKIFDEHNKIKKLK